MRGMRIMVMVITAKETMNRRESWTFLYVLAVKINTYVCRQRLKTETYLNTGSLDLKISGSGRIIRAKSVATHKTPIVMSCPNAFAHFAAETNKSTTISLLSKHPGMFT